MPNFYKKISLFSSVILLGIVNIFAAEVVKLSPHMRPVEVNAKLEQAMEISKWRQNFKDAHIFQKDELEKLPRVVSDRDGTLLSMQDSQIYASNLDRIDRSQPLGIYRLGTPITAIDPSEPFKKKILGYPLFFIADVKLIDFNIKDRLSKIQVSNILREVMVGDKVLVKTDSEKIKISRNKNEKLQGKIVSVIDGIKFAQNGQSVLLDIGCNQGVEVGNILSVVEEKSVRRSVTFFERDTFDTSDHNNRKEVFLPEALMGKVLVYQTFDNLSLALVIDSNNSVARNQLVRNSIKLSSQP
ncbi:MAG: hypothetical protein KBD64_04005 [Gammaproteobacteria bacterium]|nr:hypothetical protein [Gammaproteobacteria bacterium]